MRGKDFVPRRPLVTVGGLIVAPDGEILLVRSKKWSNLYSVPGGKIEWGESRQEAFIREIYEETSLKVTNVRFALVQDCIFSKEFWKRKHFVMNDFIADLDSSCSKEQVNLNHEAYLFEWVAPHIALGLPLHHECRILIEWYLTHTSPKSNPLLGTLGIRQHQVHCIVGIYPEERQQEQVLLIDAKIKIDFSTILTSGQINDTVDYVLLAQICTQLAQQNQYLLLENLASDILDQYMQRFNATWAWVCVQKPSAIPTAAYAYVELERYR